MSPAPDEVKGLIGGEWYMEGLVVPPFPAQNILEMLISSVYCGSRYCFVAGYAA